MPSSHAKCRSRVFKFGKATGSSIALIFIALLAGCQSTLMPLAVRWGADLISAASQNYSKNYSTEVENLLLAMYHKKVSGIEPYKRAESNESSSEPNGAQNYDETDESGAEAEEGAANPSASDVQASQVEQPMQSSKSTASAPIVLDATVLVQRASERSAYRLNPVPIQDGDTLHDGGADPRRGDAIKFSFRVNCDCYIYVIGVDGTGYVARIYPDPASGQSNPVHSQQQYVVPEGSTWYGLDQVKGVEQIFFIASRFPRQDIDRSLSQLAQTSRTSLSMNYRSIHKPTIPEQNTRGLVKVEMGTPSKVQGESGKQYTFTPEAFGAKAGVDDIVVTRWFNHQ